MEFGKPDLMGTQSLNGPWALQSYCSRGGTCPWGPRVEGREQHVSSSFSMFPIEKQLHTSQGCPN